MFGQWLADYRVDETVIFRRLTAGQIRQIVDLQLLRLAARLADRKIELEVTDEARDLLGREGYDPAFGARPLKRIIQRAIGDPAAVLLLEGKVTDGGTITVDVADGQLDVTAA